MSHKETPGEIFKRALANAARSLAEQPDLEVVFSGDGPSLVGNRAILPHPPRELSGPEATRIRALADQKAFGRIARAVVRDLFMTDDLTDAPDQDAEDDQSEGEDESDSEGEGEGEEQTPQSDASEDGETSERESDSAESQVTEMEDDENAEISEDGLDMTGGDRPARPDIKEPGRHQPASQTFTAETARAIGAE